MKTSLLILMFAWSAHAATYFVDVTNGATISGKAIPALPQGGTKPASGWDIGAVELAGGPPTGNVYFKYRLR